MGAFDDYLNGDKPAQQNSAAGAFDKFMADEPGDLARGFKTAFEQIPQLGYGLAAVGAAALESAFGEGGHATAAKKWAAHKYEDWGERIRAGSKDTDEFDVSYERAKEGDYGALVDWLQYGVGYGLGQMVQVLVPAGAGAVAGRFALRGAVDKVASGLVAKEAERLVASGVAREEAQRQAVSNVAMQAGMLGATAAQSMGMEGGEIGGDLTAEATREGRVLTGSELARVAGATVLAGSLEFGADLVGLGAMMGKLPVGKAVSEATGLSGRAARGVVGATLAAPVEGATEYLQTGIEEFGKGREENLLPFNQSPEAKRQAINAAALGVVGGGVAGVAGGVIRGPTEATPDLGETKPAIQPAGTPPAAPTGTVASVVPVLASGSTEEAAAKAKEIVDSVSVAGTTSETMRVQAERSFAKAIEAAREIAQEPQPQEIPGAIPVQGPDESSLQRIAGAADEIQGAAVGEGNDQPQVPAGAQVQGLDRQADAEVPAAEVSIAGRTVGEMTDQQLQFYGLTHRMSAFREAAKAELSRRQSEKERESARWQKADRFESGTQSKAEKKSGVKVALPFVVSSAGTMRKALKGEALSPGERLVWGEREAFALREAIRKQAAEERAAVAAAQEPTLFGGKSIDELNENQLRIAARKGATPEIRAAADQKLESLKKPGTSFLQAIRRGGGIDPAFAMDIGGDSAMELNRRLPGLMRMGGLTADGLRERAQQNGFIRTHEMEKADRDGVGGSQELVRELVRKAMRGEHVYTKDEEEEAYRRQAEDRAASEEPEALTQQDNTDAADLANAAVDELRASLDTMTQEDINAEIEAIAGTSETAFAGQAQGEAQGGAVGEALAGQRTPGQDDEERGVAQKKPPYSLAAQTEADLKAKEAQAKTGKVEEKTPLKGEPEPLKLSTPPGVAPPRKSELAEAFQEYDDPSAVTGITSRGLLERVEFLVDDGRAPESLRPAIDDFKEALREDREEYAGRGDVEPYEEAFVEAVRKAVDAETPKVPTQQEKLLQEAPAYRTDESGAPILALKDGLSLVGAVNVRLPGLGPQIYDYRLSQGDRVLGTVTLEWEGGKVKNLLYIKVAKNLRRQGVAEKVIDGILAHNGNEPFRAVYVLESAREFWRKMGAKLVKTEEGEDGIVTRKAFDVEKANREDQARRRQALRPSAGQALREGEAGPATPQGEDALTKGPEQRRASYAPEHHVSERQLDLFYDGSELRPGTTEEQKRVGLRAIKSLFTRDRRAGARLLGSGLAREFLERKGVELLGSDIRSAEDLATAAQILRNDGFETLRFFFVKDGKVIHHTAVTSRQPGFVSFRPIDYPSVKALMASTKADGYWMLHNHPSGAATPSGADVRISEAIAAEVPGFLGHVVIDQDEFGHISIKDGQPSASLQKMRKGTPPGTPELPHPLLGSIIRSPIGLADIAKVLAKMPDAVVLIGRSATGIKSIAEFPAALLDPQGRKNFLKAAARIRNFQKLSGAADIMLVGLQPERFLSLVQNGYLRDAIGHTESSSQAATQVISREQPRRDVVLKAEQQSPTYELFPNERPAESINPFDANGQATIAQRALASLKNLVGGREVSFWHRTVGTKTDLAFTHKTGNLRPGDMGTFGAVFWRGHRQYTDTNRFAIQAEGKAQDILPSLERVSDLWKKKASKASLAKVQNALTAGTLDGGPSPLTGKRWSAQELRGRFRLSDKEIGYYEQALASVEEGLSTLAKSVIARLASTHGMELSPELTLGDTAFLAREGLSTRIEDLILQNDAATQTTGATLTKLAELEAARKARDEVGRIEERANKMIAAGYFPLMRFGRFFVESVSVGENGKEQTEGFSMFDSKTDADLFASQVRRQQPSWTTKHGEVSKEAWQMFKGMSPEVVELFADITGLGDNPFMQEYMRVATSERSVMKRMLERKGTPGWSRDLERTLASFVLSSARSASSNYHSAAMLKAINSIEEGGVKDEATKLYRYVHDPMEEASGARAYLFFHFLGGSVASMLTNMSQPVLVTAPWLNQYASAAQVTKELALAMKEASTGKTPAGELGAAMLRAVDEGIVAPHEVYNLMAGARGGFAANPGMRVFLRWWGSMFALAEAWNRRSTFAAAYRIAESKGMDDPYEFAAKAVHETQFIYAKHARPTWARGPVGATLFTFKIFTVSYLEFLKRLSAKQKAVALGLLILASGINGLPGADDLDDIIDTLGQWLGYATNSKKWKRKAVEDVFGKEAAKFVLSGFSAIPGVPFDMQARLGVSNLIPGTALLKPSEASDKMREIAEVVGPAGKVVQGAGEAAAAIFKGNYSEAAKAALPLALSNAYKGMEMFATGQYKDAKGRMVQDTTATDAFVKGLGFNPQSIASSSRKVSEAMQDIHLQQEVERGIAEQWAKGLAEGKPEETKKAMQKMYAWNKDNPSLPVRVSMQQIRDRVKAMKRTRDERIVKSAPPEIRSRIREDLRP